MKTLIGWLTALAAIAALTLPGAHRTANTPACGQAPHLACYQDHDTTAVMQDVEVFDSGGAPVFWVNNAGGAWVGNDLLGITGKSVSARVAYLAPASQGRRGVLVLDGIRLSSADVKFLLCLETRPLAACQAAR